jgi:actin-like ATPase involved in cell morphogenesis
MPMRERLKTVIRGRDLVTGLPKEIAVNDEQIALLRFQVSKNYFE